jgi:hypothetical protein
MQITGTAMEVLPVESGTSTAGKAWEKHCFVIGFSSGNYEKILALTHMKSLGEIKVGQNVQCEINVSSREYKGRYYTECSCWKVVELDKEKQQAPQEEQEGDLPF